MLLKTFIPSFFFMYRDGSGEELRKKKDEKRVQ